MRTRMRSALRPRLASLQTARAREQRRSTHVALEERQNHRSRLRSDVGREGEALGANRLKELRAISRVPGGRTDADEGRRGVRRDSRVA